MTELYGSVSYIVTSKNDPNKQCTVNYPIYNIDGALFALNTYEFGDLNRDSLFVLRAAGVILASYDIEDKGVMYTEIGIENVVTVRETKELKNAWTAHIHCNADMVCKLMPPGLTYALPHQYDLERDIVRIEVRVVAIADTIEDSTDLLYQRVDQIIDDYNPDGYGFAGNIEEYRDIINLWYNNETYAELDSKYTKPKKKIKPKNDFKVVGMDGEEIKPESDKDDKDDGEKKDE